MPATVTKGDAHGQDTHLKRKTEGEQPSMPESVPEPGGLRQLVRNTGRLPQNVWNSVVRHGKPESSRARSQTVFANFFLHIHSVRTHRWSLKKSFTLGLGVASAALFIILTVTGVVLMVYYKPTTAEAYSSMKDIHYVVPGGRLLRNAHRWAANLMIISVLLHMARVFFTASYRHPREFNWLLGIGLLVLTFALSFTGYCLPWDQLAYWAIVIGTNIAGSPSELTDALNITQFFDIGRMQRRILLGSDLIGDDALLRFYWLHCIAIPLVMAPLMGLHFWRIRKDGGMSRPSEFDEEELRGIPEDEVADNAFTAQDKTYTLMCLIPEKTPQVDKSLKDTVQSWPHLFRAEMAVFAIVLATILFLGIFFDAPLKEHANPTVPENPAKAPWYFLGLQEIVSYSAFTGGVAIPIGAVLVLALFPFLDREKRISGRWPGRRETWWALVSCVLAFVSILLVLGFRVSAGWLRDWYPAINQIWIILINPGTVLLGAYFLYSLFVVKRTGSTRIGAVALFCCLLVFYIVFTYFGTVHRGPNWEFYWWPSQWPTH